MTIIIISLPMLPFGVGSSLTLPLLLGQAWLSPSRSGQAPPLPFLLAGPLAFPSSPFWLAFSLGAWPTPTRRANPDPEKEGPTLTPRKKADPYPREGRANKTGRANPKLEKEGATPAPKIANTFPPQT